MGQELSLAAEDTAAVCSGEEGYVYNINPQRRPRVLYLTHHLPWPELSGGRLREAQLIRRLLKDHDIDLIAVSRTAEEDRNFAQGLRLVGLRVHVFASEECQGAPLVRRRSSGPARRLLNSLLTANSRAYDLVHVEGHYLFGLVPPEWQPRTLLVEHNVESHLLEHVAVPRTEPDLIQVARRVHA